ncbi:MAG: pentapeptide repeat-containing protein [Candidatus Tumulicola sp.]
MIASMPQGLAHFAGAATTIAINALWEGALLVVCIWLLLRAWPRINAATRYIVWSATLVATVVVPIATTLPFLTPSSPTAVTEAAVRVPIPMVTHALTAVPSHTTHYARASGSAAASRSGEVASGAYAVPRLPERFRMTLPLPVVLAVLAIWTGLALFAFLRLAIGLYRLEQLKRDALPLPIEYRDAMARWTSAGKGGRDVRLCVSDEIDVPVAVGLFDAMILIPRSLLERLSESEVDQISLHELAHLRRADDWTNGLQRIVTALFGWSPAVLFVGQQLDLEREVACDDWVLASTGLVRPYATCLAKMAETSAWPYRPMAAPGVFATRKHISLRIERLLGAGRNAATSLSLGPAAVTVAVVGALAFAMQLVAPSVAAPLQAQPAVRQVTVVAVQREPIPAKTVHAAVPKQGSPAQAVTPAPVVKTEVKTETKTKEIYKYIRVLAAVSPGPLTSAHPAVHVHMQGMKMQIPPIDVHVPRQTILIPPVDVDVPAIEHAFASGAFAMPSKFASASAHAAMAVAAPHPSIRIADNAPVHNCSGCDMSGVNWSGRDMHGVNFTGSDLSRANLSGTNFSNGTFNGVDFTGANLRGANFRGAKLTGCDFSRADLTGVDFTGATLTGCDFTRAQLPSSEARSILNTCTGCDFGGANLSNLDLSHVRVNGVDFTHANLTNTNFAGAKFTGVNFSGARLGGATLKGAVFSGCDMSGVDLNHVDLSDVQFIGTDFPGSPKP